MFNFNKKTKQAIKKLIPPIITDIYLNRTKSTPQISNCWFGDYSSWDEASKYCSGYDSDIILEKVKSAILKVKNHTAAYERDSVLFNEIDYSWPLVAWLLRIGLGQKGKLHLLDFGGSLGSTYFQNRDFLSGINDFRWNVVEQNHFVKVGKELLEDDYLKFYNSVDACLSVDSCNVILISGVIQYLQDPFSFIEQIIQKDFEYIIFDRTSFTESGHHRLTIQQVSPKIYDASYPCWFFNEKELLKIFNHHFSIQSVFNALDISNLKGTYFKGFILKRN